MRGSVATQARHVTDGPLPVVIAWHEGPRFLVVSSLVPPPDRLVVIGASLAAVEA